MHENASGIVGDGAKSRQLMEVAPGTTTQAQPQLQ